jgi:hypothetical protein
MSAPETNPPPAAPAPAPRLDAAPEGAPYAPRRRWYHYAAPLVLALLCVELGILLVLLPWLDVYEHDIYLYIPPAARAFFLSASFRAALSAVGFLNFLVALNEFLEIARPATGAEATPAGPKGQAGSGGPVE